MTYDMHWLAATVLAAFTISVGRLTDSQKATYEPTVALHVPKRHDRRIRNDNFSGDGTMPRYVIERDLPGAGELSAEQLRGVSQKSCSVLRKLGPEIQWVESYVTSDKIYCVYVAPNEQLIRRHAEEGGFPANRISEVKAVISPTTAE
jgi:hypothetical protein